jgi:hypothetical protein
MSGLERAGNWGCYAGIIRWGTGACPNANVAFRTFVGI